MFKFNVNITDNDYLDYNVFWMTRSHYGKKQITKLRIFIAVLIALYISAMLFSGSFASGTFLSSMPLVIFLAFLFIFMVKIMEWTLKASIKSLRKKGKMGYSPTSVVEFLNETFIETTPENKTEQKYSSIERISLVDNKMIYIHVNNVMAYIIPVSCFESVEQYQSFLDFIKTKSTNIDIY